jgi:hypothetical protein
MEYQRNEELEPLHVRHYTLYRFIWYQTMFIGVNGCQTEVSADDPVQKDAIQWCYQNEQLAWIAEEDNCFRWLCNGCRIKLSISTDSTWYCADHANMHIDDHVDDNEEN